MYFNFLLLVLSFNHLYLISSLKENSTENDECSLCTYSFFRRKRALAEYTRWRSNPETTQEFIVKVPEDDISMPQTKQIVAFNIKPFKKGEDKIIVGAALLSTPLSLTTLLSDDYTRFVPPTSLSLTRIEDSILAPATTTAIIQPLKTKIKVRKGEQHIGPVIKFTGDKHVLRDESPPSGPKFITRSNSEYLPQFAPIAPIVFTQKPTLEPVTPRTVDKFLFYESSVPPTRTPLLFDIISPVRTSDFFNIYDLEENKQKQFNFFPTITSMSTDSSTTEITFIDDNDDDIVKTTETNIEINRRKNYKEKKTDEFYNNLMYDDDTNVPIKKQSFTEAYDESFESNEIHSETTSTTNAVSTIDTNESYVLNYTEKMYYDDDEDLQKGTSQALISITSTVMEEISFKPTTLAKFSDITNVTKNCSLLKLRSLSFNSPRTLHEITTQLKKWSEESPIVKLIDITNGNFTVMENPIHMMIVDDPSSGQIMSAKQTVMIVAGIQGRDHHAVAAALYLLYQLIERTEAHADLLIKYRFWIVPVFNPDGYDYAMTFPRRREWSKNLRQTWDSCKGRDSCQTCELYGIMCTIQPCYGVNLDRNFEYQWIPQELRSEHPCGNLYAGPRQLSEAETRALTHFLHEQKIPLYTFIAFKEGEVLGVMYPYSHTKKRRAFDHVYCLLHKSKTAEPILRKNLYAWRQRASYAASAAFSISGRPYAAGQTSEFLPLYAGGIEDWVDGHLGIDNTYTIMMFRPSDSYNSKLLTERVVHEAYAAVDTLLLQSTAPLAAPPVTLSRSKSTDFQPAFINILLMLCLQF